MTLQNITRQEPWSIVTALQFLELYRIMPALCENTFDVVCCQTIASVGWRPAQKSSEGFCRQEHMATSDTDLVQLHRFFLTPDAKLLRDQVELRETGWS